MVHTVELLDAALALAKQSGFLVRQDYLGGGACGPCELRGRRWLIVDLDRSPAEQLETVLAALRQLPQDQLASAAQPLERILTGRRAA